jgi:hypothetical protein
VAPAWLRVASASNYIVASKSGSSGPDFELVDHIAHEPDPAIDHMRPTLQSP